MSEKPVDYEPASPDPQLIPPQPVPGARAIVVHQHQHQPVHYPPAPPPAPRDFDMGAFIEALASPQAIAQAKAFSSAYDSAVDALLGENDTQEEAGRVFKKKSAWRKLGRFFRVSVGEPSIEAEWYVDPETGIRHYRARAIVMAVAPWGQTVPGVGVCSTRELRFWSRGIACPVCGGGMFDNRNDNRGPEDFRCKNYRSGCVGMLMPGDWSPADLGSRPNPTAFAKAEHDCEATACTRAINRAISDLIAAGEVSYEEIEGGVHPDAQQQAPTIPLLDRKVGFGKKHPSATWRELIDGPNPDRDYVRWAIENTDRLTGPEKSELAAALRGEPDPNGSDDPGPYGGPRQDEDPTAEFRQKAALEMERRRQQQAGEPERREPTKEELVASWHLHPIWDQLVKSKKYPEETGITYGRLRLENRHYLRFLLEQTNRFQGAARDAIEAGLAAADEEKDEEQRDPLQQDAFSAGGDSPTASGSCSTPPSAGPTDGEAWPELLAYRAQLKRLEELAEPRDSDLLEYAQGLEEHATNGSMTKVAAIELLKRETKLIEKWCFKRRSENATARAEEALRKQAEAQGATPREDRP